MKQWRHNQTRAALHPDDRKAASMDGSDKAFMLRHALNALNTAAGNVNTCLRILPLMKEALQAGIEETQ